MPMTDKTALRSRLRRQRASLSPKEIRHASLAVAKRVRQLAAFQRAQRIGLYMANMGELDTQAILERALKLGKRCYLPVLHPFHSGRLWFTQWHEGDPVRPNQYGIIEPIAHHARMIKPYSLDLVLMPLLGFDQQGNRLGMGKGFYDRCFSYLRLRQHWRHPELIGLAYEFQKLQRLPAEPWDIPLKQVITEAHIYGPYTKT